MKYETLQQVSTIIANLAVAATAIGGFYIYLSRTGSSRQKRLDKGFTSSWINEGDITALPPSHYMQIDLKCKEGEITGVLRSSDTQSPSLWDNLSVVGIRKGNAAMVQIVDVVRGRDVEYGVAKIWLQKDRLRWKLLKGHANVLPGETALWRFEQ